MIILFHFLANILTLNLYKYRLFLLFREKEAARFRIERELQKEKQREAEQMQREKLHQLVSLSSYHELSPFDLNAFVLE